MARVKKFILNIEPLLENIPRRDFYNRDKIRDDMTNILYKIYLANSIKDNNEKQLHQLDVIARLNMINFYVERAYVLKYISEKQLYNNTKKLEKIYNKE